MPNFLVSKDLRLIEKRHKHTGSVNKSRGWDRRTYVISISVVVLNYVGALLCKEDIPAVEVLKIRKRVERCQRDI